MSVPPPVLLGSSNLPTRALCYSPPSTRRSIAGSSVVMTTPGAAKYALIAGPASVVKPRASGTARPAPGNAPSVASPAMRPSRPTENPQELSAFAKVLVRNAKAVTAAHATGPPNTHAPAAAYSAICPGWVATYCPAASAPSTTPWPTASAPSATPWPTASAPSVTPCLTVSAPSLTALTTSPSVGVPGTPGTGRSDHGNWRIVRRVVVGFPRHCLQWIDAHELVDRWVVLSHTEVDQARICVGVLAVVAERGRLGARAGDLVAVGIVGHGAFYDTGRSGQ